MNIAPTLSSSSHLDVARRTRAFMDEDGTSSSEWIQWLFAVDDATVVCKDGGLLTAFEFDGLDIDSTGPSTLNQVRDMLLDAFSQVQEHNAVITWQVRRRVATEFPTGEFPDPVSARINAIQEAAFHADRQFINRHHVTLQFAPAASTSRLLSRLDKASKAEGWAAAISVLRTTLRDFMSGSSDFPYFDADELEPAAEQLNKAASQFAATLSQLGIVRLRGEALATFLATTAAPTRNFAPEAWPDSGVLLDEALTRNWVDNSRSDVLRFNGNEGEVVAAAYTLQVNKRQRLHLDMLDGLMAAPLEFTLSHVFKLLPSAQAEAEIAGYKRYHAVRRFPIKAYLAGAMSGGQMNDVPVNEQRDKAAKSAEALENQIQMGKQGIGRWHATVLVQAATTTSLSQDCAKVEEILLQARMQPMRETLHKFSSFCATVPGSHTEIARWFPIQTENMADMSPIRTVGRGSPENRYLTEQTGQFCPALLTLRTKHRTPFYFTGFKGDLGHTLLLGTSGYGKTTLANLVWSGFRRYPGAQVIGFDKNYSMRPAVALQGGAYLDVSDAAQTDLAMAPLAVFMAGERPNIKWCVDFVLMLVAQQHYTATAQDRVTVETALRALAISAIQHPQAMTLTGLMAGLDNTKPFAQALKPWTQGQSLGRYFDNAVDGFEVGSLTAIENGSILSDETVAPPYMSYVFKRIETQLQNLKDGSGFARPTLIYIPEAWYFLRSQVFQDQLFEYLVTLRKLTTAIWFDTQSPDKIVESGVYSAFRDNVATTIFTPNDKARSGTLSALYRDEFLLSDAEIAFIASGKPKRDFLIKQGELSRQISLNLDPETLAYLRSDKAAQTVLARLQASGDPDWRNLYVAELLRTKE